MIPAATVHNVHCVVCDDVRLEVGYKETIVGVYIAGMTIQTVPWYVTVCVWMTVIWSGEGDLQLELRVLNPRLTQVGEVNGVGHSRYQGQESTLTFRGLVFAVDMEGTYSIQWRAAGGAWETVRQFPIYITRTSTSA
jgi:hypothetical protein